MKSPKSISLLFIIQSLFFFTDDSYAQRFEWARGVGGSNRDMGVSITTDDSGNVYTTGTFLGTIDFDSGPGVLSMGTSSSNNTFISKMDKAGNIVWAKAINNALAYEIITDGAGCIYVTGSFSSSTDFDPGPGVLTKTSAGESDIYILKLKPDGTLGWAKTIGGIKSENGYAVKIDKAGKVYCTGYFNSTVDFDAGTGVFNLTATGTDVFITKLDSAGNYIWAKQLGGTGYDYGMALAIDTSCNVLTTGRFTVTADFNPGSGVAYLSSSGNDDIFVSKLDSAGNYIWSKQMGGTDYDWGYYISTDVSGNTYTTGSFIGTANFNPGGVYNLTSASATRDDIFISKLDAAGNFIWAKRIGGLGADYGKCIINDISGNIYITGAFGGTVDFDPNAGTFNVVATSSATDAFVAKLTATGNFVWAKSWGDQYSSDGGNALAIDKEENIVTTGLFGNTVDFDPGPSVYNLSSAGDFDIYITKLTPCIAQAVNNPQSICQGNVYIINNNSYNVAGSYKDTFISVVSGCDSIVNTILSIVSPTASDTFAQACKSFAWYGNTYTVSGNQTRKIVNAAGCDSIITLHLTIDELDTSTTYTATTITANQQGANYQWLNCKNNNQPIGGETNQSFTPTETGDYAVIVSKGACSDTSSCTNIILTGINSLAHSNLSIAIYPNPNNGKFIVDIQDNNILYTFIITDILGKTIFSQNHNQVKTSEIDLSNQPSGTYFIQLKSENKVINQKIIIHK